MKINFKQANRQNYIEGRSMPVKWLVIHYTANQGDTAKNNADYFAREGVGVSANYFVDESEIWQSVKDTDTAQHCGGKRQSNQGGAQYGICKNSNSIGIEICMNDKQGKVRHGSIKTAAELVRYLMQRYSVPLDHVIRHHDVTGKHCPGSMVDDPELWESFKKSLVQEADEEMKVYKHTTEMPGWARDTFVRLVNAGIVAVDDKGEISVQDCSLQPMVYIDRLCGGNIQQLSRAIKTLNP